MDSLERHVEGVSSLVDRALTEQEKAPHQHLEHNQAIWGWHSAQQAMAQACPRRQMILRLVPISVTDKIQLQISTFPNHHFYHPWMVIFLALCRHNLQVRQFFLPPSAFPDSRSYR